MARTHNGSSRNRSGSGSGSGCFSCIVKLLPCKGSLQADPSSDREIIEPKTASLDQLNLKPPAAAAATPGVVARLMGLDSLPVETNWVGPRGRRTPLGDCVTRSRSVNFMDYLLELDFSQQEEEEASRRHRRLRTSVSFREVPELVTQGNQNLFLLYLNDSERTNNKRKHEMDGHKNRQKPKRKENCVPKEKNQPKEITRVPKLKDESRKLSKKESPRFGICKRTEVSSACVSSGKKEGPQKSCQSSKGRSPPMLKPINEKEVLVESKFTKKMKKKKKANASGDVESVFSSEGSSPVSVLDLKEPSSSDCEPNFSEHVRIKDSKSKKKPSNRIGKSGDLEPRAIKKKDRELAETANQEYHKQLTSKLRELTEQDVEACNWVTMASFKFEGFEEICSEFGQGILDLLLFQVAEELVVLYTD